MTATRQIYRLMSWFSVAGIVAFFWWISTTPSGWSGAPVAAAIMLALVVATLGWRKGRPVAHWTAVASPPQTPRVLGVIAICIGVQIAGAAALILDGRLNALTSVVLSLVALVGVPLVALAFGVVRWPKRVSSPGRRELAVISLVALGIAALFFYLSTIAGRGVVPDRLPGGLMTEAAVVLTAATMEEVLFRVLLLTALMASTGSRFQALVLSSVVFALGHVPLALAEPVIGMQWDQLAVYATPLWPEMVLKIGFAFLSGALWLRTGSLPLIAVLHGLANFGPVLTSGLGGGG